MGQILTAFIAGMSFLKDVRRKPTSIALEDEMLKETQVELNYYKEDWNGPHEETTNSNTSAILI